MKERDMHSHRKTMMRIIAILTCICLLSAIGYGSSVDRSSWKNKGTELLLVNQKISSLDSFGKAFMAYNYYCTTMTNQNAPLNSNLETRATYGTDYTCEFHTENLMGLFEGLGIPSTDIYYIAADDADCLATMMNCNHIAAMIQYNGYWYVFDPWEAAFTNNGSYTGRTTLEWNAMTSGEWNNRMVEQGYDRFSLDGGDTWSPTVFDAITDYQETFEGKKTPIPTQIIYDTSQIVYPPGL
jgi:hypothetical protein